MRPFAMLCTVLLALGCAARTAEAAAPKPLLIVAPRALVPAVREFAAYKRTLLRTEVVTLEDALRKSRGVDDPERLKRFLYDRWKAGRLGYVLLVGDCDVMPVRYMVLDRVTPAAFDYAFYPSDLYYADLAKADGSFEDWNGARDSFHAGYFGEVRGEKNKAGPINYDGVHYHPVVGVGRWPADTPEQVALIARKTMRYEKALLAGSKPGARSVALIATDGWVDARGALDDAAKALGAGWQPERRYYAGGYPAATPPPTEAELYGLLAKGVGLVLHAGHGDSDIWYRCCSIPGLIGASDADRLPVLVSVGCSTAYFAPLAPYGPYTDVEGGDHKGTDHGETFAAPPAPPSPYQKRYNPTGLGEAALLRNENGAVAYIGCDTGSQPCALTLLSGFARAVGSEPEPRLGDAWAGAVRYYYDHEHLADLKPNADWYPPSIFFQAMKFMVFGDPSLRLPGPPAATAAGREVAR